MEGKCKWEQLKCTYDVAMSGNKECASPDIAGQGKTALDSLANPPDQKSDSVAQIPQWQSEYDKCRNEFAFELSRCDDLAQKIDEAQKETGPSALDQIIQSAKDEDRVCGTQSTPSCNGSINRPVPKGERGDTVGLNQNEDWCVTSLYPVIVVPGPRHPGCFNYQQTNGNGYGAPPSRNPYQNPNTFGNSNTDFECQIQASPTQLQRSPTQTQGQAVQLQWQTRGGTNQNPPYRAGIYGVGPVNPSGSTTVYPQQTTEYILSVAGYQGGEAECRTTVTVQNQNQNPHGTGTDGRACTQPPAQPSSLSCSAGTWKPVSATGNGCVTGWQCVPGIQNAPTAEIRCEPQTVDVGMSAGIAWGCANANQSTAIGFDTQGSLSGVTTTPPMGTTSPVTYSIMCSDSRATTTASCSIQVAQPILVFVANPDKVTSGSYANLGWVTTGASMQACRVSSPDFPDFTALHANDTATNGVLRTPPLTATSQFVLTCLTVNGSVKVSTTTVSIL